MASRLGIAEADPGVGVPKPKDQGLGGHAGKLGFAVGQGAEGVFADDRIARQFQQDREAMRP
jgi:hypothetical protein